MKKKGKPYGSSIEQQEELREDRPAPDLTLRDFYQGKADLKKERLLIFESAQHDARALNLSERDRENEILQLLLKLGVAETHLRRDLDRRRASARPAAIEEESPPDIEQSVE